MVESKQIGYPLNYKEGDLDCSIQKGKLVSQVQT